jgi:uncharacterized membrane protein (UPF0136 family)
VTEKPRLLRPEWLEPSAIALIMILAVALRFWGIRFGFPEHVRPDEQYYVNAVQRCDRLNTLDPDFFYYPSFYTYINLAVWRGYTFYQLLRGRYQPPDASRRQSHDWGVEQIRARSPDIDYLLGRCVTALFGVATVALVYAIARRFYGRKAAVAAALLLAVNELHTLNSHFYKSDVATTFFIVAALGCMGRYVQGRGVAGWNLGAAILSGLAASTNYYGGFLVVPLLAGQFLARREKAFWRWETYAMPAIALAAFGVTSPYCLIRWTDFLNAFHRMLFADRQSLYDTMVRVVHFEDFGFQNSPLAYSLLFCFRYSMGSLLSVVAVGGLVFLALRRRPFGWLLLLFFAVHFLMTASGKAVFMRYCLPLVPVLTIAVGVLLSWALQRRWPNERGRQNIMLAAAVAVCGITGLFVSVQQDRLLARTDTRVEAREWLAKNLPPNAAAVGTPMDWWGNYYPYGKPTLPSGRGYVPLKPDQVIAGGIRYVLIDDSRLRLYSPPNRPEWESWLSKNAKLLYEVSPYRSASGKPPVMLYDQLDAFYLPVAGFTRIARPGPRISIHEVRPLP